MSRKTTGVPGTTRRRVLVGTAMLSTAALVLVGVPAASAAPAVTSVKALDDSAAVGPLHGGSSTVKIVGTDLDEVTGVWFGSTAAVGYVVDSETLIYATPPAGSAGAVDVTLGSAPGTATPGSTADDYTYTAAPVVSTVTLSSDKKSVDIVGQQLSGATAVLFGDTLVKVDTKNKPATATTVSVKAPSLKSGSVAVSVVTPNGVGTKTAAFGATPKATKMVLASEHGTKSAKPVTSAHAATGTVPTSTASTGTAVILTGTGFSGTTSVKFGQASAAFVVVDDSTVRAVIPPKHSGDAYESKSPNVAKVEVVVTNAHGASKGLKFSYLRPPAVTSATDVVGKADAATNTVTLAGDGLEGAKVTFGTKAGKVTASSNSSLTVTAPKQAAGEYDVKVVTPGGSHTVGTKYTYASTDVTTAWTKP